MKKIVKIKRAGLTLVGTMEIPELKKDEKCPIVIIMHGFTGNRNEKMLVKIAEELLQNGIASVRFDFNGHGESEGLFEDMTVANELEDAGEILRYVKQLDFASKVSILGHSQGGVVAGMTAGYYPDEIDCLVQMAPAATLKEDALEGKIAGVKYDSKHIPKYIDIKFYNNRLRDQYFRIAQHLPIYEVSSQYNGAVCLIHGKADEVVSYAASKRYHEIYSNSELHILENENHIFGYKLDEAVTIAVDFIVKNLKA